MAAKKYEEMDDHELMLEMVKMQKKDAMGQKLTAYATIAIFVAVLIALLMIVPRVIILLDDISKTVKNADTAVSQVQNSISELDAAIADMDTMVTNIDDLVVTNTDSLNEAVQKLNDIDFDTLNKAINDFSATVEPLANFFGRFSTP